MTFTVSKPDGTFYWDWIIRNDVLYAIFEHDTRKTTKQVTPTTLTNNDWRKIDIQETESELVFNLSKY